MFAIALWDVVTLIETKNKSSRSNPAFLLEERNEEIYSQGQSSLRLAL